MSGLTTPQISKIGIQEDTFLGNYFYSFVIIAAIMLAHLMMYLLYLKIKDKLVQRKL